MLFGVAFAIAATSTPLLASRDEDSRIEAAAKQSFVYRTYLKNEKVNVQSKDGCVTLKGKVSSEPLKGMAADTVEKSVDNQLEVKAPAKEKSDASDIHGVKRVVNNMEVKG